MFKAVSDKEVYLTRVGWENDGITWSRHWQGAYIACSGVLTAMAVQDLITPRDKPRKPLPSPFMWGAQAAHDLGFM